MRCEHCGMDERNVIANPNCAPPFVVQPHAFNGRHPADVFERANSVEVRHVEPEPHHEANVERHGGKLPDLIVTRGDGVALPDQAAARREFIEQATRPKTGFDRFEERAKALDTSELGPVRHDPGVEGINARVVREALQALADDDATNPAAAHYLAGFAREASEYTLAKLRRLLK